MSTATKADKKLTPKQEMFCLEYLIDLNATQASIRAGYSERTAKEIGYELLTKPHINARVQELALKREKRAEKSADDVIKELECVGFARLNKVISFNESGAAFVKGSDEIDDDTMAALESVEVTERGGDIPEIRTKVKMIPKTPALTLLAKHHKVCTEKVEHSGAVDVTVNVVKYGKEKGK